MQFETNFDLFNVDLKKFANIVDEEFDTVFRKVVFLLFRNVILLTPVDTGRARSNWNIGVNEPDLSVNDVGEGETLARGKATSEASKHGRGQKFGAGDTIYITNNVDYVVYLEDQYNMVKGAIAIVGNGLRGALN